MGSSYINHFLQPDSIIPDPSNPQAWNRFSYVFNNPINLNDPSGHAGECAVLRSAGNIIAAELCERIYSHPEDALATYIDAGMYQQNWGYIPKWRWVAESGYFGDPYYESQGPGRISDAQMNTSYGTEICPTDECSEDDRGLGLGLYGQNQHDENIARAGMARRIIYGLDMVCVADCSATDKMMVAALAANGDLNATNYKSIKNALAGNKYRLPNGQFDWNGFIKSYYKDPIQKKHLLASNGSLAAFFGRFDSTFRKRHSEIDWNSLNWIPTWRTGPRSRRPMNR